MCWNYVTIYCNVNTVNRGVASVIKAPIHPPQKKKDHWADGLFLEKPHPLPYLDVISLSSDM